MNTALVNILAQTTDTELSDGAWLMFAFGCIFLYGGLIFGIVRAIRGKLPYPQHVLEKAADVGWLVALGTLATVAYLARQLRGGEHELHILWWIALYVVICVPLAILCRHLVIVHYKLTRDREEPNEETGIGGTTE
ncbi:MAG TPA: hypothetical protein VMZ92_01730 [Planctomycetota bacterium]|nr:hypothetical protein [Planctomycetota bacterium]